MNELLIFGGVFVVGGVFLSVKSEDRTEAWLGGVLTAIGFILTAMSMWQMFGGGS